MHHSLALFSSLLLILLFASVSFAEPYSLTTFQADVTPPLGHPLLAGWKPAAKKIGGRLEARGVVLLGAGKPIVIAALDWCELRNETYDSWREAIAKAVDTSRERVLLSCLHQHDAPYADLGAQRVLDAAGLLKSIFDPEFCDAARDRVAAAAKDSLAKARAISHYGAGSAEVKDIACNRRVELPGRPIRFDRYSFSSIPEVKNAPVGQIDPLLKTLTFYAGDKPIARVHSYATHPMSTYGGGEVSPDFVGLAREFHQRDDPAVLHIYVTGAAGDITAARYNEGTPQNRIALAERLRDAMRASEKATKVHPLAKIEFRNALLKFPVETRGNLAPEKLKQVAADPKATQQARSTAALGLSWQERCAKGQPIDLPVVDFGGAVFVQLPAESFIEYQLAAQKLRPDAMVVVAAFGESAPGYIPTEQARKEGFVEEHQYTWTAPGAEEAFRKALGEALVP